MADEFRDEVGRCKLSDQKERGLLLVEGRGLMFEWRFRVTMRGITSEVDSYVAPVHIEVSKSHECEEDGNEGDSM